MDKVIIDIGSGNIKAYIVKEKQISQIYGERIMLKDGFEPGTDLSHENEIRLLGSILEVKRIVENRPIFTYATSVFRTMHPCILNQFQERFQKATGLELNVISQEQENQLIAASVGQLPFTDPYLVCCVGGGSTEMIVMDQQGVIENLTVEFANADMLKQFPQLKADTCTGDIDVWESYVKENMQFPKTQCKNVIMVGWHLLQTTVAGFPFEKNTFFENQTIPYYMNVPTYRNETEKVILNSNLQTFQERLPEDKELFNGFRGCSLITRCLLEAVGAEHYFPSNLNMIHGIVNLLDEE